MLYALLSQFFIEIIVGLLSVAATPFIIKYSRRLFKYFRSLQFEKRMKKVYDIYTELKSLQVYLKSDRVLLLRTTNGGGLPSPGKVLYATIVAEVSTEDAIVFGHNQREEWQNRMIDHEYIRMLEKVYTDGSIVNVVSEMPKHSMLRGAYETMGVERTKIIKLGIYNDAFYYVSIVCKDKIKPTSAQEYTINTCLGKIKKLLE